MTANKIYLSVILVIVIVIIAYFAWRSYRRRHAKEHFTYSTPATPRVREAALSLFDSLDRMMSLGHKFERQACELMDARPIAGARLSAAQMVRSLGNVEKTLRAAPPTYANYLAVYRGMASTDIALLDAADAYTVASIEIGLRVGKTLRAMGHQLRHVVATVHRLGVALDVE